MVEGLQQLRLRRAQFAQSRAEWNAAIDEYFAAEHLNFKATAEIKKLLATRIPKGRVSLWLEEAILAKARAEGLIEGAGTDA